MQAVNRNIGAASLLVALVSTVALCLHSAAGAQDKSMHPEGAGHTQHTVIDPASLTWKPVSATISIAHLSGSPDTEGAPFVIRLKLAPGTNVPPHWHPTDEHLTVISGTFHMGMGETFDKSAAKAMSTGAYCAIPKESRHFGFVDGETIVQIHGIGPFKTFFVGKPAS